MRLTALVLAAIVSAAPAWAQSSTPSSNREQASTPQDGKPADQQAVVPASPEGLSGPVSLEKIKGALEQLPVPGLVGLNEVPQFKVEIHEKQPLTLQELIATLDFKAGPTPAGGIYAAEIQRQASPAVNNPLTQPYAAFNQGELLTILAENLARRYLVDKAVGAITSAERSHAESAAKAEVQAAIAQYCAAQPNAGAGIAICTPER